MGFGQVVCIINKIYFKMAGSSSKHCSFVPNKKFFKDLKNLIGQKNVINYLTEDLRKYIKSLMESDFERIPAKLLKDSKNNFDM